MRRKEKPFVILTMGDLAGIGPEILARVLADEEILAASYPVVVGDGNALKKYPLPPVNLCHSRREVKKKSGLINLIELTSLKEGRDYQVGKPNSTTAAASFLYLTKVRALLKAGAEIVVTAPVSKEGIIKSGRPFVGQTEELAKGRSKKVAMMLVNKNLKVVLTTTHLPLKKVPSALTKNKIYQIIVLADEGLKKYFNLLSPKLAVSGLNPHCGEGGMKGREEITKIIPAIKKAQQEKINVAGPFPADTLFTPEKIKGFDAMIVMYHDQGLIPVKMAGLAEVVNVTLGLPFIRTSPGHGPAFDIAGKNQAEAKSMKLAVKLALKMFERRQNNDAPCSNSLPRNRQNSYL